VQGGKNKLDLGADARVILDDSGVCLLLQCKQINGKLSPGCCLYKLSCGGYWIYSKNHVYIDADDLYSGRRSYIDVRRVRVARRWAWIQTDKDISGLYHWIDGLRKFYQDGEVSW
jgi:hypothetical protein